MSSEVDVISSYHPERGDSQPHYTCEVRIGDRLLGRLHGSTPEVLNRAVLRLLQLNGLPAVEIERHELVAEDDFSEATESAVHPGP